jgi:predicted TIM-barrel fold metal-dependent hydrolase
LRRYLADAGVEAPPGTLDAYLEQVVASTLDRQKRDGAIAVKFEAAYLRSLDVAPATRERAAAVYARYATGGEPPAGDYKLLQDFLFRTIALEAGRRGMAVHIHVGAGAGAYYRLRESNPDLLEPVLNDPSLRGTQFVLIHGGWPFERETALFLGKPNVYADFSAMTFLLSARTLSVVLRTWLELSPEKVLYATDGFPLMPQIGWEEVTWLADQTGREALTLALTDMVNDGSVTPPRALALARMVLRENAIRLYASISPGPRS